jgi:hypothetical protein
MRLVRFSSVIWIVCVLACSLVAQQATVNHGVSLRGDPSTKNPATGHLSRNAIVTLLATKPTAGFYHVQTADGTKGWVGVKYLTVGSQTGNQPPKGTSTGTTGTSTGTTGTATGSAGCDATLWSRVYNPQRLIVKQKCATVTGTIVDATAGKNPDGVRHEADGDTHGWLKVDAGFENLLNAGNKSNEGGNLVFEIVCKFPVTQADAQGSPGCQGYKSSLKIPPVGSHVKVVGSYVQDTNHAQWMEIHPVSSITVIP